MLNNLSVVRRIFYNNKEVMLCNKNKINEITNLNPISNYNNASNGSESQANIIQIITLRLATQKYSH